MVADPGQADPALPCPFLDRHCHINELEPPFSSLFPEFGAGGTGTLSVSGSRAANSRPLDHIATLLRANALERFLEDGRIDIEMRVTTIVSPGQEIEQHLQFGAAITPRPTLTEHRNIRHAALLHLTASGPTG